MITQTHSYLIGIDGGGTSCRFAIQTPNGVRTCRLGTANVYTAPDAAIETLLSGIRTLAEMAGVPVSQLSDVPIYAGLAGVTDAASAKRVADQLPSSRVWVENDARSAVVGSLGSDAGCVVGIGTGTFLARQSDSGIRFIGGYGAVLGDEASGGWLGKRLLSYALHVIDGLAPSSALIDAILDEFRRDPQQIVNFSMTAKPADYGAFAPRVADAAASGDSVGLVLMNEGAAYVVSALNALGRQPDEPVCPIGGVASRYADYLPEDVVRQIVAPKGSALEGTLSLAARIAESDREEFA